MQHSLQEIISWMVLKRGSTIYTQPLVLVFFDHVVPEYNDK